MIKLLIDMVHLEDPEPALPGTYPLVAIINLAAMHTLVKAIPAELYLGLTPAANPARAVVVQAVRVSHSRDFRTVRAMAE